MEKEPGLEPVDTIEAMHIAGQEAVDVCIRAVLALRNEGRNLYTGEDLDTALDVMIDYRNELRIDR